MDSLAQMPPHYSLFSGLDIPAGEKDFVIRESYTLPVAVDGSKDEMGSISLIAVPHEQSELPTLRSDLRRRDRQLARERMLSDPALAAKVARILAE